MPGGLDFTGPSNSSRWPLNPPSRRVFKAASDHTSGTKTVGRSGMTFVKVDLLKKNTWYEPLGRMLID